MGKASYDFSITHAMGLMYPGSNDQAIIDKEVNRMLTIMPDGTTYTGYIEQPVISLAIRYTFSFEHPSFQDGTTIETLWNRVAWKTDQETMDQATFFAGIIYRNPDGSVLSGP